MRPGCTPGRNLRNCFSCPKSAGQGDTIHPEQKDCRSSSPIHPSDIPPPAGGRVTLPAIQNASVIPGCSTHSAPLQDQRDRSVHEPFTGVSSSRDTGGCGAGTVPNIKIGSGTERYLWQHLIIHRIMPNRIPDPIPAVSVVQPAMLPAIRGTGGYAGAAGTRSGSYS